MIKKLKELDKSKKIIIYTCAGVLLVFFIWWIIAAIVKSPNFPTPIEIIPIYFSFLGKGDTYLAIGGTFLRILISFAISFVLGMILGVFAGYFYRLEALLRPLITILRTLPTAAVVLILITLIRPFMLPIIVTSLVMFPLFYEAFLNGVKNINKDLKDELDINGASPVNSFFKVYVPTIMPYILLSIIQSLGLGMKVSIMAEILSGSNINGLGQLIRFYAYTKVDAASTIALSLIAITIIVIFDVIFHYFKKGIKKNHGRK